MVWNETKRLYNEMLASDGWPSVSGALKATQDAHASTQRLALCVILSCGFGISLGWKEETYASNQQIRLSDAIKFQADNLILLYMTPKWLLKLPLKTCVTGERASSIAWWI